MIVQNTLAVGATQIVPACQREEETPDWQSRQRRYNEKKRHGSQSLWKHCGIKSEHGPEHQFQPHNAGGGNPDAPDEAPDGRATLVFCEINARHAQVPN